ncbi:MAG: ornithine cyclodeaminase family protein [Candidatus Bipolaricaulia bacterium]
MALFLREADVQRLLSMELALEAVEEAFRQQGLGMAANNPRIRVLLPTGQLNVMAAGIPSMGVLGFKAYSVFGGGVAWHFLLYSAEAGELLAIIEANHLGRLRTGAASGVATKYLARSDARTVGIIGTGFQADAQLMAVCKVRSIEQINAYSRNRERREAFCTWMTDTLETPVTPVNTLEDAVQGVDIAITMTTATSPVLKGNWLKAGAHINAAGSNALIRRELDETALQRSRLIVVDSKEQAKIEAGDFLAPIQKGTLGWDQIHELGEVVIGGLGRKSQDEITLFKSLGVALEDVAVAAKVYERALQEDVGDRLLL